MSSRRTSPFPSRLIALMLLAAPAAIPASAPAQEPREDDGPAVPVAEYRERRQKAMGSLKDGIIVLLGTRDEEFGEFVKFRQKNDLMYLTGVSQPDAKLILVPAEVSPDGKSREILFLPARNPGAERWMGKKIGPGTEAQEFYGIAEALPADRFQSTLIRLLLPPEGESAAPARGKRLKVYGELGGRGEGAALTREGQLAELIRKVAPGTEVAAAAPAVAALRKIKSPAEQILLQKAIDITGEAQRDVARTIRPGVFEYAAQASLEAAFTRNGAERPGFFSIVGSGPNSTVLHYNDNRRRMKDGDLVVVDIGAEFHYYTADITRTYPVSGKFTPRQREVYQLVLDAQKAAEKVFVVGKTSFGELTQAAQKTMRESPLRDSQGNTLDRHFIHGLGHWLGMDVHDVGDYNGPLPVGAVFTIEPGIYLSDEALGVRIEDDYLVTETGLVKLSAKIPSEPDDVEKAMGSGPVQARVNVAPR